VKGNDCLDLGGGEGMPSLTWEYMYHFWGLLFSVASP
jgi:hypothetical protein